jgi:PAS domain S-box-containing protein
MPVTLQSKIVRVLVVEDNEADFVYLRYLLHEVGRTEYEVDWTQTYEEAKAAIAKNEHDVYIFDYSLGARNGLDLLREAKQLGCQSPMILLTGAGNTDIDLEAEAAGASDYLDKTGLDGAQLERSIRYSVKHADAHKALRESQRRLEQFMKNVPCAVSIKNNEGRYLFINDSLERATSRNFKDWIGKTDMELWPSENAQEFVRHDKEVLDSRHPLQVIESVPHQDGLHYWLASKFPMYLEEGEPLIGTAAIDITERIKAEISLQETTQILQGILENLPVVVIRLDERGQVLASYGRELKAMNLQEKDLVGNSLAAKFPDIEPHIRQSLSGESTHFIWKVPAGKKNLFFDTYFFFDTERRKGAIGFALNITELLH